MVCDRNPLMEGQIQLWRKRIMPHLVEALAKVPEDKLDWMPAEKMITLGNIFLHIAESSDWWYGEVIKGQVAIELSGGACPDKETIAKLLQNHRERLDEFFAEPPEILARQFTREVRGKSHQWSGSWIFTHLLEHDIHHRSQINQYLRILGIEPPGI